jgi:hypothetical protein
MFDIDHVDPFASRTEALFAHGLNIVMPDFIMLKFELEPLYLSDFIKPKANIQKLRAIMRNKKKKYE